MSSQLGTHAAVKESRFPHVVLYRLRLMLEVGMGRQALPVSLGSTVRGLFAARWIWMTRGLRWDVPPITLTREEVFETEYRLDPN